MQATGWESTSPKSIRTIWGSWNLKNHYRSLICSNCLSWRTRLELSNSISQKASSIFWTSKPQQITRGTVLRGAPVMSFKQFNPHTQWAQCLPETAWESPQDPVTPPKCWKQENVELWMDLKIDWATISSRRSSARTRQASNSNSNLSKNIWSKLHTFTRWACLQPSTISHQKILTRTPWPEKSLGTRVWIPVNRLGSTSRQT